MLNGSAGLNTPVNGAEPAVIIVARKDTPGALAQACGAAERGVRILADYLVVLGLLEKPEGRYRLSADAGMFLDERSPAYMGEAVEFLRI